MTKASCLIPTSRHKPERIIFTVGHSIRLLEDFIRLLQSYGVTMVVDVRKMPRSRANPQYNQETLPRALGRAGIGYVHLAGLGGLRSPQAGSPNCGLRNRSFQAYADYMQTPEFEETWDAAEDRRQCAAGAHVRRSRTLALSSLLNWRRTRCPRHCRSGHP